MVEILQDAVRNTRESLVRICEQETTQIPFTMHNEKFEQNRIRYANEVREWRRHESLRFDETPSFLQPRISPGLEAAIISRPQQTRALLTQSDVQVTSHQLIPQGATQQSIYMFPNPSIPQPGNEQNSRSELSGDPFEQEIQIMSNVVAYLELSIDRIIESIAMAIITFWRCLGDELKLHLEKKLNLTAERVDRLALDDSDVRGKRKELTTKKYVLNEALRNLRRLNENDNVAES